MKVVAPFTNKKCLLKVAPDVLVHRREQRRSITDFCGKERAVLIGVFDRALEFIAQLTHVLLGALVPLGPLQQQPLLLFDVVSKCGDSLFKLLRVA